jgi:ELWxxDGT repeat protein
VLVKDIYPGSYGSAPNHLTVVGTQLFFAAGDDLHSNELFKTDGTASGTVLVKDIVPGPFGTSAPHELTALGDLLVFAAADPAADYYTELWVSDGTEAGTVDITPSHPPDTGFFEPLGLTNVGRVVLFKAWVGEPQRTETVWKTNGTKPGTVLLKDLYVNVPSYGPTFLRVGGLAYFAADDGVAGNELWSTDLTPQGTILAADIWPGSTESNPAFMARIGPTLYFAANDGVSGGELWALG